MYKGKVSTVLTYLLCLMGTALPGIWWQQLGTDSICFGQWIVWVLERQALKTSIIDLVSVIVQNEHLPCKISP